MSSPALPSRTLATQPRATLHTPPGASAVLRSAALRDASAGTLILLAAIFVGSGALADFDPALIGYCVATVVAAFALIWKISAFWRRPASALYGRALLASLRDPRRLRRTLSFAGRDLAAQDFIRRRSRTRWLAHVLLSFGTLASFAVTVPLVFGWMHFAAEDERFFRVVVCTVPTLRFDVGGWLGWTIFHALSLAATAVALGSIYFLVIRLRARRLPGSTAGFSILPLLLLLFVALSGLALPATRGWPVGFGVAARVHELSVIVLLMGLPFSKLAHVLIRPLQLGVRALRAPELARASCSDCGEAGAPLAQQRAVAALLAANHHASAHVERCPACRRKHTARMQAQFMNAHFQPPPSRVHREVA